MSEAAQQRRSRWPVRVALLLASSLVTLALLELSLRAFGFSYRMYPKTLEFGWPNPEQLDSGFVPDPELLWVKKNYANYIARLIERRPDLVLMGCSCTDIGRYDKELEASIKASAMGEGFTFANIAHSGWSSFQGLQQMRSDVVRIRPKVVTIFFGWNDHWFGFGVADKVAAGMNSSLLYHLQDWRVGQLAALLSVKLSGGRREERPDRVSPGDFRANLRAMVDLAQEHGILPVLLTAPTSHQRGHEPANLTERWLRNLEDLVPLHQEYVSIVREVAAEKGVLLCDLAREFEGLSRAEIDESFWSDGIHFSKEGNQRVGEMVFRCFQEHGVLEALAD